MTSEITINIRYNDTDRVKCQCCCKKCRFLRCLLRYLYHDIGHNLSNLNCSVQVLIDNDDSTCEPNEYILELSYHSIRSNDISSLEKDSTIFEWSSSIAKKHRQSEHKLKFTEQTTVKELYDLIDKFLLSKNLKKAIKKDNN